MWIEWYKCCWISAYLPSTSLWAAFIFQLSVPFLLPGFPKLWKKRLCKMRVSQSKHLCGHPSCSFLSPNLNPPCDCWNMFFTPLLLSTRHFFLQPKLFSKFDLKFFSSFGMTRIAVVIILNKVYSLLGNVVLNIKYPTANPVFIFKIYRFFVIVTRIFKDFWQFWKCSIRHQQVNSYLFVLVFFRSINKK